jgi:hypothetical protein
MGNRIEVEMGTVKGLLGRIFGAKRKKQPRPYWFQERCAYCSAPIRVDRGERKCPLRCQQFESNEEFFGHLRALFDRMEREETVRTLRA